MINYWESQKNARNSLHSIIIGSSTLGKRALFIWLKMAAVKRVENDDAGKNYDPSSFKNSCPGTKTSDHIESDVKAFYDALNDGLRVLGNDDILRKKSNTKHCWQWLSIEKIVWLFCRQVLVNRLFISCYRSCWTI